MATLLASTMPITDSQIWRGASRILIGDTTTPPTWPAVIEDILNLETMALEANWIDLGATSDEGVEVERGQDVDEGIAIDQRDTMLRPGRVSNVKLMAKTTLMYTDIATIKKIWEAGTLTSIAAVALTNVAQKSLAIGSPSALTNRLVAILQQNDTTGKMRVIVLRKGKFTETGSLKISAKDTSMIDVTLEFEADISQTDGTDFGLIFEED